MTSLGPLRRIHTTTPCLNYNESNPTFSSQTLSYHSSINNTVNRYSTLHREDFEGVHRDLHLAILEGDKDTNIKQDIRSPKEGEEEVVTQRVKDILRGVYHGDRAKLAEAITLGMCECVNHGYAVGSVDVSPLLWLVSMIQGCHNLKVVLCKN